MDPTSLIPAVYPPLRAAHLALATASVALFVARGLGVLAQAGWPMRSAWRGLSVAIDVGLLNAGVGLWWLLQVHPVHQPWLGVKLLLLVAYVVLGSFALKRGRTRAARAGFFVAALVCVAALVTTARSHDPLGALRLLGG